jgi:hypothetical protein
MAESEAKREGPKKEEAAAPPKKEETPRAGGGKGFMRTPIVVGVVMLLEAVVLFAGFKFLGSTWIALVLEWVQHCRPRDSGFLRSRWCCSGGPGCHTFPVNLNRPAACPYHQREPRNRGVHFLTHLSSLRSSAAASVMSSSLALSWCGSAGCGCACWIWAAGDSLHCVCGGAWCHAGALSPVAAATWSRTPCSPHHASQRVGRGWPD